MTGEAIVEPIRQSGNLRCGDFSPDGSRVALGSERGAVTVWKANNDLEPLLRYEHIGPLNSVTFDHSGTRVVSTGNDGKAIVSAIKGSEKPEGTVFHGGRVLVAVFHPNDEILLTASSERTARLWKLSDGLGVPVGEPFSHEDSVNWAEFSPDGLSILTASGDGTVSVWSVLDQRRLGVPIQHSGPVLRAHFDSAGKRVVLIGSDNVARVWDLESRRPLKESLLIGVIPMVSFGSVWGFLEFRLDCCSATSDRLFLEFRKILEKLIPSDSQEPSSEGAFLLVVIEAINRLSNCTHHFLSDI
jgi:hypothetical protein